MSELYSCTAIETPRDLLAQAASTTIYLVPPKVETRFAIRPGGPRCQAGRETYFRSSSLIGIFYALTYLLHLTFRKAAFPETSPIPGRWILAPFPLRVQWLRQHEYQLIPFPADLVELDECASSRIFFATTAKAVEPYRCLDRLGVAGDSYGVKSNTGEKAPRFAYVSGFARIGVIINLL